MKYLTVLIVIAISGCSVPATVVGRFFDDGAVRKLPEGTSMVSVLKQLGTPQVTELLLDEEGTETWVYSATYDATQDDINLGDDLVNTASVVSTEVLGPTTDDATTTITQDAALTVDKIVDLLNISAPATLTYTITVDNTGNVDITNVVVTDDLATSPATFVGGDRNTNHIL